MHQLSDIKNKTVRILSRLTARLSGNTKNNPPIPLDPRPGNTPGTQSRIFNANALGILQRPCRPVKKHEEPEPVFVMVRRNCKVYVNIEFSRRSNRRLATILETGSGSSYIRKDVLPESIWNRIKLTTNNVRIHDANTRSVHVDDTIDPFVDIGGSVETISFNVVERLATKVIIEWHYCDK